jgi:hypothetical protein
MQYIRTRPQVALVVTTCCTALTVGAALLTTGAVTAAARVKGTSAQVRVAEVRGIPFRLKGMTFSRKLAAQSTITETQAIQTAEKYEPATSTDGQLLPNVTVEASYGLWSSDHDATMVDGNEVLTYLNVPAWVVAFSGAGFQVGTPWGATGEESVVVNATTGQALISLE